MSTRKKTTSINSKSRKRTTSTKVNATTVTVEKEESFAADLTLPTFECRDQALWDRFLENNSKDPYSFCVARFTARWANFMERELAAGKQLEEVADQTSSEADDEGITGFMYGCAVSALAAVWKHGDQLRRWHNIKYQIRDEGERANETGGVLNPAVLTVG